MSANTIESGLSMESEGGNERARRLAEFQAHLAMTYGEEEPVFFAGTKPKEHSAVAVQGLGQIIAERS